MSEEALYSLIYSVCSTCKSSEEERPCHSKPQRINIVNESRKRLQLLTIMSTFLTRKQGIAFHSQPATSKQANVWRTLRRSLHVTVNLHYKYSRQIFFICGFNKRSLLLVDSVASFQISACFKSTIPSLFLQRKRKQSLPDFKVNGRFTDNFEMHA